MKTLFLLLILCIPLHAQDESTIRILADKMKYSEEVETTYDRFEDSTDVKLFLQLSGLPMPLRGLSLIAVGSFKGEKLATAITPNISIMAVSESVSYKYSHSLILLVDGVRIPLGDGLYTGGFNKTVVETSFSEIVVYSVGPSDWEKIKVAKKIEGKFGNTVFELKPNQIEALKDFHSKFMLTK